MNLLSFAQKQVFYYKNIHFHSSMYKITECNNDASLVRVSVFIRVRVFEFLNCSYYYEEKTSQC